GEDNRGAGGVVAGRPGERGRVSAPWIAAKTRGADATPLARTFVQQPPMLHRVRLFLELVRFSHTVFALPFALISAVLAWNSPGGEFRWLDLLGIVLCMVFARSAAM